MRLLLLSVLFPIPALPPSLTSSFGEYREGHLHRGVDFSTSGKTGWFVVAVESGFVIGLQKQRRGYGKSILLLHPGGWKSFYAHLESFSENLEHLWSQQSGARYGSLVIPPQFLPVRAGEIIGKTGESGAGLPHLHFETLFTNDWALNPLLFLPAELFEEKSVQLQLLRITFVPLQEGSKINGNALPQTFPLKFTGKDYVLPDAVTIEGKVGVELEGFEEWKLSRRSFLYIQLLRLNDLSPPRVCFTRDFRYLFTPFIGRFSEVYQPAFSHIGPSTFTVRLYDLRNISINGPHCSSGILTSSRYDNFQIQISDWREGKHFIHFSIKADKGKSSANPSLRTIRVLNPTGWSEWAYPEKPVAQFPISPENPQTVEVDTDLKIQFPSNGVLRPLTLMIGKTELSAPPNQGLKSISPAFFLFPAGEPCNAVLHLRRSEYNPREAFFRWDGYSKRWRPLPSSYHSASLTASIPYFSIFAVWEDVQPPEILPPEIWKNLCCVIPIYDLGLGIQEENIRVMWNHKKLQGEYDPDRGWWESASPLSRTQGTLWIEACDKGQNCAVKVFTYPASP